MGGGNNAGNGGFADTVTDAEVDIAIIPTIRSREVRFRAQGLLPNTRHFPFFDGVRVDDYCYPLSFDVENSGDNWRWSHRNDWDNSTRMSAGQTGAFVAGVFRDLIPWKWNNRWANQNGDTDPGDPSLSTFPGALVSDANGTIEGVFVIPNNDQLSFPTGTRIFSLYDITTENDLTSASRAKTQYFAEGIRRTITQTINRNTTRIDPIAQTFYVDNNEGVFITKVGVYFQSKDSDLPVQLQIRPVVNGYPSATEILPNTTVWLNPDDVAVSSDASSVTNFVLPSPTYLKPGKEYAIVILTQSLDYNVWIARMGDFPLGVTDRKITSQPSLGSLFKSQNSSTWEPSQFEDLKFTLSRAVFATSGSAIFENQEPTQRLLPNNPFLFDSGDATVRVIHPNHGYFVNDNISLLFDSAETLPMGVNSVLGSRTITAVDATGYTFEADSSATSGGRFGGLSVKAPDQVLMDYVIPSINTGNTVYTTSELTGKFTTGKSLAGTETPYGKDVSYGDPFKPFERKLFTAPRLIASRANEVSELAGAKSVTIQAALTTTTDYLSPVINAERASLTAINNVIDNQDSAATAGFNVPLTFVNETDPTLGSSIAKYVTKPITIVEDAVGLKMFLGANKPTEASFDVYYKAITESENLDETAWTLVEPEVTLPSATDPNTFYEYKYLVGGLTGTLTPFTTFQVKIVMHSTNSSRPPTFRDLRILALAV